MSNGRADVPLVSVLIIMYNQERFAGRAMNGMFAQRTDFPVEIIVGDDASCDGTPALLVALADRHRHSDITLILREYNIGASANLYDLCRRAKGKYIALLEGDDYWIDPDKLQKQFVFLEGHSEYIACAHDVLIVDESERSLPDAKLSWLSRRREFSFKDFKGLYLPGQTSTLMFRNIFLKPQSDYTVLYRAHRLISDRVLVLILASMGKIYRLPETLSCYRKVLNVGAENATSSVFINSTDSKRVEYTLTAVLEDYTRRVLGLRVSLWRFKVQLLFRATAELIFRPGKDRLRAYGSLIKAVQKIRRDRAKGEIWKQDTPY